MAEFRRSGPHKVFTDVDVDGEPLDHWMLECQSIIVKAVGSDGMFHLVEAKIGLDVPKDSEIMENFFLAAEAALKRRMIDQGVWV